jgi:hypothetical protein
MGQSGAGAVDMAATRSTPMNELNTDEQQVFNVFSLSIRVPVG